MSTRSGYYLPHRRDPFYFTKKKKKKKGRKKKKKKKKNLLKTFGLLGQQGTSKGCRVYRFWEGKKTALQMNGPVGSDKGKGPGSFRRTQKLNAGPRHNKQKKGE